MWTAESVFMKKSSNTALHLSIQHTHWRVVRWLLKQGANPQRPNAKGKTPLELLKKAGKSLTDLLQDEKLPKTKEWQPVGFFKPDFQDKMNREKSAQHRDWCEKLRTMALQWEQKKRKPSVSTLLQREAKRWGFQCHEVKKAGNCFFEAVYHQLMTQGLNSTELTVQQLREKALNYLIEHFETYRGQC